MATKSVLVFGATGKQGSAVVDALLSPAAGFSVLAVTRDPESASAKRLAAKSPSVKVLKGDLDDVPAIFAAAKEAAPDGLWGVFLVTLIGKNDPDAAKSQETVQGVAVVDAALAAGVKHFVFSSVDRGGDKSWDTPTDIPHFRTKHLIEHHLRDTAGDRMRWTILRPVIFFENLEPTFTSKLFMTLLRDTMGAKPMPWIATADIGFFAGLAFREPETYNHVALTLAGDEFNWDQMDAAFVKVTGYPVPTTFSLLAQGLRWVEEVRTMMDWFKADGYVADIPRLRALNPKLLDLETWLREKSKYDKVQN